MKFEEQIKKKIFCEEKHVEGSSEICIKCNTNHTMTFEYFREIIKLYIDKQKVKEAIIISKSINQSVEEYIDEFKKELGLE